eukprot:4058061-Karenia_brevis.AAC.1
MGVRHPATFAILISKVAVPHVTGLAMTIARVTCASFNLCGFCASSAPIAHENSTLCMEAQMDNIGCHSCGRLK